MSDRVKEVGELAFEQGFKDSPPVLWRVLSWREFNNRRMRHTNWFATEDAAKSHAAWISDGRGEVISVTKYVQEPQA